MSFLETIGLHSLINFIFGEKLGEIVIVALIVLAAYILFALLS